MRVRTHHRPTARCRVPTAGVIQTGVRWPYSRGDSIGPIGLIGLMGPIADGPCGGWGDSIWLIGPIGLIGLMGLRGRQEGREECEKVIKWGESFVER